MRKAQSILFSLVFVVALFLVLAMKGAALAGIALPQALHFGQQYSYVEGREAQAFPELSVEALSDGTFQSQFENYVSDMVPQRERALLANAALQRVAISQMASLMGFQSYPTFFGSDYAYIPEQDALIAIPSSKTAEAAEELEMAADAINAFAQRHPELAVALVEVPRRSELPDSNPAFQYVSDPIDRAWIAENLIDCLDGDIPVIDMGLISVDEQVEGYYRTDHHWQAPLGYQMYLQVLDAMQPGAQPLQVGDLRAYDVAFNGSAARSALCLPETSDSVIWFSNDMPEVTVAVPGQDRGSAETLVHTQLYDNGEYKKRRFENHYVTFFHGDYPFFTIENQAATSDRTLLLVGDSFSNCTEILFAQNWAKVVVVDPRRYEGTIDEVVTDQAVDDVVFLASATTYRNELFPSFLAS